jgi:hypothetical protein
MATVREESWQIKRRSDVCAGTGEPFADREEIMTRLREEKGEYLREDYRLVWWNEHRPDHGLCSWKSIFRLPPPPDEPVKKESAEGLLRQLVAKEDSADLNAIYILAVMLERKRVLIEKEVQQRGDQVRVRVYEHKKTGETFLVVDPELKLAEIEKVQEEVIGLLGGKPPKTETVGHFEVVLHTLIEKHEKRLFPRRSPAGEEAVERRLAAAFCALLAGKKNPHWEASEKLFARLEESDAWGPTVAAYRELIECVRQEVRFLGLENPAFARGMEAMAFKEPQEIDEREVLAAFSGETPRLAEVRKKMVEAVRTAVALDADSAPFALRS